METSYVLTVALDDDATFKMLETNFHVSPRISHMQVHMIATKLDIPRTKRIGA